MDDYDDGGEQEIGPVAFARYHLGDLHRRGVIVPELMCRQLLYRNGFHSLAGEPDSGKTTLAYWFAAELLGEGGRVMIFDEEQGPEQADERLLALGAEQEDIDERTFYYPFPGRKWTRTDVTALSLEVAEAKPDLVIFDSAGAFMAMAGLDENNPGDCTRWYKTVMQPLTRNADLPTSVLLIDHDTKAQSGGNGASSRYARGSGSKLGIVDVQFKVQLIQPFSRSMDGQVKLVVSKDRRGYMHPRRYRINVSRKLNIEFESAAAAQAADREEMIEQLTATQSKVYQVLDGTPMRKQEIANRVTMRFKYNVRPETVGKVMAVLVDMGIAVAVAEGGGRGHEARWVLAGSNPQTMFEPGEGGRP